MVHKEYRSLNYYAQTFRDFIQGLEEDERGKKKRSEHIYKLIGTDLQTREIHAEHHASKVSFNAFGIEGVVEFVLKNDVPYASLEIYSENGSSDSYEKKLKVSRSKKGRINVEKTYVPFFEEFIIPHLREALKEK